MDPDWGVRGAVVLYSIGVAEEEDACHLSLRTVVMGPRKYSVTQKHIRKLRMDTMHILPHLLSAFMFAVT